MKAIIHHWQEISKRLKIETYALYLAYRNPRTPWYARLFTALVVAYAFSPIDLIPDFIPVLGYLDDLLLIPLGVKLALRMIPPEVMQAARANATQEFQSGKQVGVWGMLLVIAIWLLSLSVVGLLVWQFWYNQRTEEFHVQRNESI
jgi:uncharacterized membrane protein YkvA (DUF1232 family)